MSACEPVKVAPTESFRHPYCPNVRVIPPFSLLNWNRRSLNRDLGRVIVKRYLQVLKTKISLSN